MKYSKTERLKIGEEIYNGTLTVAEAAQKYNINLYTARDYFRMYKAENNISDSLGKAIKKSIRTYSQGSLSNLTKEDLIRMLAVYRIREEKLKHVCSNDLESKHDYSFFIQMEYKIIENLLPEFGVKVLSEVMNISPSAFYKWREREKYK